MPIEKLIKMEVVDIRERSGVYEVILRGEVKNKEIKIPIRLDKSEAMAIKREWKKIPTKEISTFELLVRFARRIESLLKTEFIGIVITKYENKQFFVELSDNIRRSERRLADWAKLPLAIALALALRMGLKIYVSEEVIRSLK